MAVFVGSLGTTDSVLGLTFQLGAFAQILFKGATTSIVITDAAARSAIVFNRVSISDIDFNSFPHATFSLVGTLLNTSGDYIDIVGLTIGDGEIVVIPEFQNPDIWFDDLDELKSLINAEDIELRDSYGNLIASNKVAAWIDKWARRYVVKQEFWLTSQQSDQSVWLSDSEGVGTDVLPVYFPQRTVIRAVNIITNASETTDEYAVYMHKDPDTSPESIGRLVLLSSGSNIGYTDDLELEIQSGFYGLTLDRIEGNGPSNFTLVRATVLIEPIDF